MIIFNNVWFSYNNSHDFILKGISLQIREGEFVALIGPNGAGKTTLAKHINGLLKPIIGSVLVDDIDTRKASVAELAKKVGYVFQNPDKFLFSETVEDELRFTLKNLGYPDDEIPELIDKTLSELNLLDFKSRSPFSLSGGEQRRVALAAILVGRPKYLILDEPTVGQDALEKKNLAKLLKSLNENGTTILIITHDIEFISELVSRTIVLKNGHILLDGPTNKVLTKANLLSMANIYPPQISQLFLELNKMNKQIPSDIVRFDEALSFFHTLITNKFRRGGK
ncbi:MAG: energy-coupling factor ABC transporter ATP-binding protein [Candidatus Asgardarchaeia archaeon]